MTVEFVVDPDLLPQVLRELFAYAVNPDDIKVTEGEKGRVILVPNDIAEDWFRDREQAAVADVEPDRPADESVSEATVEAPEPVAKPPVAPTPGPGPGPGPITPVPAPAPVAAPLTPAATEPPPVKRGPGRPRKILSSATSSEVQ